MPKKVAKKPAKKSSKKSVAKTKKKTVMASHQHGHQSVLQIKRKVEYEGRKIEVLTQYEVKINGKKVNIHWTVGEDGRLTTHAIPYRTFESPIELIKALINLFPDEV